MNQPELNMIVTLAETQLMHERMIMALVELVANGGELNASLRRLYQQEQSPELNQELTALENKFAETRSKQLSALREAITRNASSIEFKEAAIEQLKQAIIE